MEIIFKLLVPKHQTLLSSMVFQNHPGIPTVGTQTSAFTQPATRVDASGWHLPGSHQMARGPIVEKYSKDLQGSCFEHFRTLDASNPKSVYILNQFIYISSSFQDPYRVPFS